MITFFLLILVMMLMKNYSIWLEKSKINKCNKIHEDLNVDVLIVGGGITGLSTLYHLKDSGLNTILVERNTCGQGVTSRSTAKITYLQEKVYMNIRNYDTEIASKYLKSQIDAVKLLVDIIKKEKIDCDLKQVNSYIFTNKKSNIEKIKEEVLFLNSLGVKTEVLTTVPFNEKIKLALKVNDTYVFHPLKYINHLKNMFYDNIYEDSKVIDIDKKKDYYLCNINGYKVKAKYVVIATHYPYFLLPFMLPMKSHIETSYIGAKKVKDSLNISAINIDNPTISLRYYSDDKNNYLIYLYNSFKSANVKNIKTNFDKLNKKCKFDYNWSNKDIISNDYIPFIGSTDVNYDTFFIACGYNTWGMTNGTLAGKVISDIILKKENPYIELFNPYRKVNLSKLFRFPVDLTCNIKAIIKSTKNNVNNSKVIYKKIDNKDVAIYIDNNGKEHIVLNKCPHMKCGLIFNEVEKTWYCLCHGSRFDIDGKCIEGPSNHNITLKSEL